jgi:hypothetical protein
LGPGSSQAQTAKEFKATIRNKAKLRPDSSQVWPAADAHGGIVEQYRLQFDRKQVDLPDSFGRARLHSGAKKSNCDVMRTLMETENVDLNARNSWGQTPLRVVC